jgi:hypothetical protein
MANPRDRCAFAQPLLRLVLKRQFSGYCATLKRVLEGA